MKSILFILLSKLVRPLIGTKISRYILFRKPYQYIYNLLRPRRTVLRQIQGNQMYIDPNDQGIAPSLLLTSSYEPFETQLFMQMVKPGMTVFDIGANIGYYTLIAARIVGSSGIVYAFEPDPENYQLLIKNIELNKFTNVVAVQKALSKASGEQRMYKDKYNRGMVSFSKKNVSSRSEFFNTKTVTLDNFVQQVSKVDIIKLDVEGAEGHVIGGGRKLLSAYSPTLFMEFIPANLKNMGTSPHKLLETMEYHGYSALLVNEKDQLATRITYSDLLNQFNTSTSPIESANLILYKKNANHGAFTLNKTFS